MRSADPRPVSQLLAHGLTFFHPRVDPHEMGRASRCEQGSATRSSIATNDRKCRSSQRVLSSTVVNKVSVDTSRLVSFSPNRTTGIYSSLPSTTLFTRKNQSSPQKGQRGRRKLGQKGGKGEVTKRWRHQRMTQ